MLVGRLIGMGLRGVWRGIIFVLLVFCESDDGFVVRDRGVWF